MVCTYQTGLSMYAVRRLLRTTLYTFTYKARAGHFRIYARARHHSSLFLQLYIAKVPIGSGSGSGENFLDPAPDPTKKVRIRIRNPAVRGTFHESVVCRSAVAPAGGGPLRHLDPLAGAQAPTATSSSTPGQRNRWVASVFSFHLSVQL